MWKILIVLSLECVITMINIIVPVTTCCLRSEILSLDEVFLILPDRSYLPVYARKVIYEVGNLYVAWNVIVWSTFIDGSFSMADVWGCLRWIFYADVNTVFGSVKINMTTRRGYSINASLTQWILSFLRQPHIQLIFCVGLKTVRNLCLPSSFLSCQLDLDIG